MAKSLVLIFPDRPPLVEYEGGIVWISIHDQYYLDRKRRFLGRIKKLHPDKNWRVKNGWEAGLVIRSYRYWRHTQDKWYAQFGLVRPDKRPGFIKKGNNTQVQQHLFTRRSALWQEESILSGTEEE